jgi:hypothetical protein
MGFVSYAPAPDEAAVTSVYGVEFCAGAVIEVDEAVYAKLRRHPQFSTGNEPDDARQDAPPRVVQNCASMRDEAAVRAREYAAELADAAGGAKPATS